jgi:hypothetical protein
MVKRALVLAMALLAFGVTAAMAASPHFKHDGSPGHFERIVVVDNLQRATRRL